MRPVSVKVCKLCWVPASRKAEGVAYGWGVREAGHAQCPDRRGMSVGWIGAANCQVERSAPRSTNKGRPRGAGSPKKRRFHLPLAESRRQWRVDTVRGDGRAAGCGSGALRRRPRAALVGCKVAFWSGRLIRKPADTFR